MVLISFIMSLTTSNPGGGGSPIEITMGSETLFMGNEEILMGNE